MISDLLAAIQRFPDLSVAVIGDVMLDAYIAGPALRLCPEAPVPVVDVFDRRDAPGGAGNTAANVRALGARTRLVGVVGTDQAGIALRGALHRAGVPDDELIDAPDRGTLAKQRVMAGSQLVVRYDQGSNEPVSGALEQRLLDTIREAWYASDAIIVSDYGYGVVTDAAIRLLADLQVTAPRRLALDSKRLAALAGIRPTLVKPNFAEARALFDETHRAQAVDRAAWVVMNAAALCDRAGAEIVAVTLDCDGAVVLERGQDPLRCHASRPAQPHPAGAGDTFLSAFTLALAAGASTEASSRLATAAADYVVTMDGTVACPAPELLAGLARGHHMVGNRAELCALADAYRTLGRRIVFTNGCFDILHTGHVACLTQARSLGDVLVVGLNSDASVRRLKGMDRPINPLEDRAAMLGALRCVDHVVPFDEDTPVDLVRVIRPHVFVKGGDYAVDELPEAAIVRELGGTIQILPYVPDHSTTATVSRIRATYATTVPAISQQ